MILCCPFLSWLLSAGLSHTLENGHLPETALQQELNSTHPLQTLGLHTVNPFKLFSAPQACLCTQTAWTFVRTHTQRFLFSGSWQDPTSTDLVSFLTLWRVPQPFCGWELQPGQVAEANCHTTASLNSGK